MSLIAPSRETPPRRLAPTSISEVDLLAQEAQEGIARDFSNGIWGEAKIAGIQHNEIVNTVNIRLWLHFQAHPEQGRVYTDGLTYVLKGTPNAIAVSRLPDLSVMSLEQRQAVKNPAGLAYFAPMIAVEVVSPTESPKTVRDKVDDYLTYGTQEVWVIYPDAQEVIIHQADRTTRAYALGDSLASALLPDFQLPLADLFSA
jgi:Uma2 family endonuclease